MDAASNNSVEDVRSIREEVNFLPTKAKYRVYIIDEVHMLSTGAFNALLKTLEEPPAHVKFVLATTEPQKLPATILSRCQRFDFKKISEDKIIENIGKVIVGKDIICTDSYPSGVDIEVSQLQITTQRMKLANEYALLNPCLPFFRGEEVSEDVIDTKFFVGYQFKESLLWVQQAIIIWLMLGGNVDES